jgi:cold shock CspA family protein
MESVLGRVMGLLPADWGDEAKLAVIGGGALLAVLVLVLLLAAVFGKKRAPESALAAPVQKASSGASPKVAAPAALSGPDLNPEEWVSGNVIHYDRQRAFGYIRCDRVKGHVRFQADGFKRAPRVGEKVRFKGRHGAMRKPVAVVVERAG